MTMSLRDNILIDKRERYVPSTSLYGAKRDFLQSGDLVTTSRMYNISPIKLCRVAKRDHPDLFDRDINILDKELVQTTAYIAEQKFSALLKSLGIDHITEEELKQHQRNNYGMAILTPDVLFETPVIINGREVNWIDFKYYMGRPEGIMYKSNVAQAEKYNHSFGPGAVCYQFSFIEGMKIPNTLILDISSPENIKKI